MRTDTQDWEVEFSLAGAYWRHDGNPRRPFALLSSGMISDGYFNAGRVVEDGVLFGRACESLWRAASEAGISGQNLRIVGAAMGAISLCSRLAEAAKCRSAYADRIEDDFAILRSDFWPIEQFLLVEDTVTTGRSLDRLRGAVWEKTPHGRVLDTVLTLCNRSGETELAGMRVLSLISPSFKVWSQGENPFTPDGKELVPPERPKQNWHALTRAYN